MEMVWEQAKAAIKKQIPGHSFRMWIEPLHMRSFSDYHLVLETPNLFSRKRVNNHYSTLIEKEMAQALGKDCKLSVEVCERKKSRNNPSSDEVRQIPIPQLNVRPHSGRILRRDFTFDQFVVGGNNDFAYSAALSLASKKQVQQNTLFLLSRPGMGKSHLSQAVGHHILNQHPDERVYYITAEDFTNEMIGSFRNNNIDKFKEKYRKHCDVLLLEDIHFLTGKEKTQIELALTLDCLLNADKRLIFTSCYLPVDIPKMQDQLKSRLLCSLISTIEPPNFRTRIRILQKKSKENGYDLPEEVTQYLAGELSENVRQLESGLIGVAAKASLMGQPVTVKLAESVVKNIARRKQSITIEVIKNLICRHYKITINDLVSNSRKQSIVRPRQVAIYLSRKYTDQPLQAIGRSFNRYHATALHSIGVIEKGIKQSGSLREQVLYLGKKLDMGDSGKN
ncbi:MAG TPA: chromosomal replication initiator protein DnaA [Deltaproteobacteria bacterium]|nr:chromosomal replication initiator protein DnaA [Deltaproteobacteria bacterium]